MMTWNSVFFQSPATFMMELVSLMHDYVSLFILSIMILVLLIMSFLVLINSFNLEFLNNHQLETMWTLLPFIILIFIVVPSLFSLYMLDTCLFCGFSLSVMGHQWYWSYFYKDLKEFYFDSYMMSSEDSSIRLLDVDNRLMIPTYMPIRFLISSADVIHSWTIPSLGVKMDAVPGRVNQFCFSSKRSGIYFGQCSEICGANHSFMPIVLESMPYNFFVKVF